MDKAVLEAKIKSRGEELFAAIRGESPSVFKKDWWAGKVMEWAMRNESFKIQLFRFVDVLPYLTTEESLIRHIEEYFGSDEHDIPAVFRWGAKGEGITGKLSAKLLAGTIKKNIISMAHQFIIGENMDEGIESLNALRKDGLAFTVDILGEAAVSEKEAEGYQQKYLALLDRLEAQQGQWPAFEAEGSLDWGHAPRVNLSLKPTSFYSQTDPAAFDLSVEMIYRRLLPVLRRAKQIGAFACLDMEQYRYKDITLALYRRLKADEEFRDYPHFGMVLQSYLRDTEQDLEKLLAWARSEKVRISIRLVKGAYWDYEMINAIQHGWELPVHTTKAATDAAYERLARTILENHDLCHFACGSHNIRTVAAVLEMADELNVPAERYEFQILYGMGGPIKRALKNIARRVRLYCAYGELLPGMGYLVRRLLENTSNESFLRQTFLEDTDAARLLADPAGLAAAAPEKTPRRGGAETGQPGSPGPFRNEPLADFTKPAVREGFFNALAAVREEIGATYPLLIGGKEVQTGDTKPSFNPAAPKEVVGRVCQAGQKEIELAIDSARKAMPGWQALSAAERAEYQFRAAEIMRRDIFSLAAWQILEVGKQWNQAYADITEAIDFLEYYGREMIRYGTPRRLGDLPGELNHYGYQPKGLAVVIAPWNFPLAISCGMSSAALVTGNCVLYKPSGLSSVTGYMLAKVFAEAGLPPGVFNFVPGPGSAIGDFMVRHPLVNLIAFTGSVEVGTRIAERVGRASLGQMNIKKVIAEMGGKNAIIIDDDADLDEAVPHVLASAFGYQGQKCSACSRVIIVEPVYARFVERLLEAARSLPIGPAEEPGNVLGPVVDKAAQQKITDYISIANEEGSVILSRKEREDGYYVPLTIVEGITPKHHLAREEIFGPVLSLMRVPDFDAAIAWANSTPYALTGGVFSRSPRHLDLARKSFKVGNLYLNRGITGALVGRQPFGGFKMSGIGSKAGGPDYLRQFMDPVSICENTIRRGFAPVGSEEQWL